jgi:chromosome partitioning protein
MELLGLAEVADLLGVTKQNVANWRSRRDDFPQPIAALKSGPVWSAQAIANWATREGISVALPEAEEPSAATSRRAIVVAMMNMKGGVGKSTLTANLGWYGAARRDLRVLLVDLDPQFNLSQYVLGVSRFEKWLEAGEPTIDDLFKPVSAGKEPPDIEDLINHVSDYQDGSCLHLIPSRLDLAWSVQYAVDKARVLRDNLEAIRDQYDVILIDCSPTESVLSKAAYFSADYIAVPVKPEFLATIGLPLLIKSVNEFRSSNPNDSCPDFLGIIFNDVSDKIEHRRSIGYVKKIADELEIPVFENELGHSDSYPAGARNGQPIFWTNNARDAKKNELARLAREFFQGIGL